MNLSGEIYCTEEMYSLHIECRRSLHTAGKKRQHGWLFLMQSARGSIDLAQPNAVVDSALIAYCVTLRQDLRQPEVGTSVIYSQNHTAMTQRIPMQSLLVGILEALPDTTEEVVCNLQPWTFSTPIIKAY